jgi:hypothetical protein
MDSRDFFVIVKQWGANLVTFVEPLKESPTPRAISHVEACIDSSWSLHCETGEPGSEPGLLRYAARKGSVTVATSTEKIIPFKSENHRVVGGNRQSKTTIKFPPDSVGEDRILANTLANDLANANGPSMETGPRIYIPAKTHPHLGMFLVNIQVVAPSTATLARGITFSVQRFDF